MNIELKKIKYFPSLSEETSCFTAEIFVNGEKAGYAKNRGHGEGTDVYPDSKAKDLFQTAEAYCKLLPAHTTPGLIRSIPMDLAVYVDELLGKFLAGLEQERIKNKLSNLTKNHIIVDKKELDDFRKGSFSAFSIRKLKYNQPLIHFSPDSIKKEIERVKKQFLKPDEVIYNDFSYLDMIYFPAFDTAIKAGFDWKSHNENLKKNFEILATIDRKSKALDQILYRYFSLPVADGKAFYQIVAVTQTKAKIRICEGICGDEYMDSLLGSDSTIPLGRASQLIKSRDALEEIFGKK